ncbi:anti-sigma factor [Altererythrobacter aquiaggeris]|uniref:anti-sigma factor n=1 Tax=Aestuarierythrobacter aquiaggeris TaxID=1898396 RepID=UPI003015C876
MADDFQDADQESGGDPFDPVVFAGKYALGVLEGDELADARRRLLAEPDFATDVDWWNSRLAALAELAGEAPVPHKVWDAISARLDRLEDASGSNVADIAEPPSRFPFGWSVGSALAGAAAAALALYVAVPGMRSDYPPDYPPRAEPPIATAQQPQLIAQLSDSENGRSLATRIDRDSGQITLKIRGLAPEDETTTATELWVVPVGGVPRSLGLIPGDGDFTRAISTQEAQVLIEGATLAVTFENAEGAPHEAPSTPILLAGPLTEV